MRLGAREAAPALACWGAGTRIEAVGAGSQQLHAPLLLDAGAAHSPAPGRATTGLACRAAAWRLTDTCACARCTLCLSAGCVCFTCPSRPCISTPQWVSGGDLAQPRCQGPMPLSSRPPPPPPLPSLACQVGARQLGVMGVSRSPGVIGTERSVSPKAGTHHRHLLDHFGSNALAVAWSHVPCPTRSGAGARRWGTKACNSRSGSMNLGPVAPIIPFRQP